MVVDCGGVSWVDDEWRCVCRNEEREGYECKRAEKDVRSLCPRSPTRG